MYQKYTFRDEITDRPQFTTLKSTVVLSSVVNFKFPEESIRVTGANNDLIGRACRAMRGNGASVKDVDTFKDKCAHAENENEIIDVIRD